MKLIVENLGIINQAKIDLTKKIILFCGRNSTGKTYAAYILQAFLDEANYIPLKCMDEILQQLINNGTFQISKSYILEWSDVVCKGVEDRLGSVFGVSDTTIDKLFNKFSLKVEYTEEDYQQLISNSFESQLTDGPFFCTIKKHPNSDIVYVEGNIDFHTIINRRSYRIESMLCYLLRSLALNDIANVRMLTVERNSIYTFKTELSLNRNELIDQIQQSGKSDIDIFEIVNRSSRRYPQAVRSSLRIANDLETIQKQDSPFAAIANYIESDLLLGEVSMTKNGDVEFRSQGMTKGKKLPFHLSSSIVKTMASLIIYLRHLAKQGDMLIIDEPEMNFHPDVQILLARILAMLSAKGLHIVVSTHSDYIIRELNNLIMAGAIKSKSIFDTEIDEFYSPEMLINHRDVSVLYFNKINKTNVSVTDLRIDEDGFAIDSMDYAINKQNLLTEKLFALLCESKNNDNING